MVRRSFLFVCVLFGLLAPLLEAQLTLQDKFFNSNGVKIRYIDVGHGEPIVLVHGFTGSIGSWTPLGIIEKLAKDFRVIALDCRGHGKSDKPHDGSAYGNAMVEDVANLLDHLNIPRAHIVGYSMGAVITGKFVTRHQDRVITATFGGVAPLLAWTEQNERESKELVTSLEQGKGLRPLILRLLPPNEPRPSDDVIDQQAMTTLGQNDPLALAGVYRGLHELKVGNDDLKVVHVPLLAMVGSADPLRASVSAFNAVMPTLKVVVIEGATHSGPRGAAARPEFTAGVHDFIAAHRGP
jgi:pimeloyl-ACP methyl ester carboxylesterase